MVTWFWCILIYMVLGLAAFSGSTILGLPVQQRLCSAVLVLCAGMSTMFANWGLQFRCPMNSIRKVFVELLRWILLWIIINNMYNMYSLVVFFTMVWFWSVLECAQPALSIYDRNTYFD